MKMERTFAYRRKEIVTEMPFVTQLRNRWPALFTPSENPSVEKGRECILKALCVYLNESPYDLIKEFLDVDPEAQQTLSEQLAMVVYVIQHEGAELTDDPEDVKIIIEGVEVQQDVKDVANGCTLLLGLIYCVNLEYPSKLKYTFEFIQKVLMDMDGQKLSRKVQVLKGKLYE